MNQLWQQVKNTIHSIYSGAWWERLLAGFATIILVLFLLLGAVDVNFLWLFGRSPGFKDIAHPITSEASFIISADSVVIGKYYNENRTPVTFQEISPKLVRTLISTEDERFYQHHGIDVKGLFAAVKDMVGGHARGASTITQQLAKNLFRVRTKKEYSTGLLGKWGPTRLLTIKAKEWIVATKLEILFSKEDILTMYFNTVDFGNNAYGIKTACETYFATTPDNLTYEQAATLVGLLKATSTYNPRRNPRNSTERRNVVLANLFNNGQMIINGMQATKQQLDSLQQLPMTTAERTSGPNNIGPFPYFRDALRDYVAMLCQEGLVPGFDAEHPLDLDVDGLKIYTTLDTKMQRYAEEAARKHMKTIQQRFNDHWRGMQPWQDENHNVIPHFIEDIAKQQPVYQYLTSKYNGNQDSIDYYLNKPHTVKLFDYENGFIEKEMSTLDSIRYMEHFMHCGFVAMEPQTGYVKAWVGDIDFDHWKYDKVTAMRQPGSTFKLFVYTEAMEQGLTPCDKRRDEYFQMEVWDEKKKENVTWRPTNSDGRFTGDSMPLRAAFARSVNSVAVRLGQEMGIKNIIETAHNMGIKSKLDDAPSLALGSSDVTLLELTNAYSCIANNGRAHERAILITKIVDRKGNVIYEAPTETKQAVTEKTAFLMQQILHAGVTEGYATSQPLWKFVMNYPDCEFGGKTGTSNNHSDAWFVATSPKLVCATWVGGEYRCIHFRTGQLGQGSRAALPLCGYFIEKVLADPTLSRYHGKYEKPKDADINRGMYECSYHWVSRSDTLDVDSLGTGAVMYDEEGNPITPAPTEKEGNPQQENASAATEQSGENL